MLSKTSSRSRDSRCAAESWFGLRYVWAAGVFGAEIVVLVGGGRAVGVDGSSEMDGEGWELSSARTPTGGSAAW